MTRARGTIRPIHPFTGRDLPWLLQARATDRKDHPFLIWEPLDAPAKAWTYGEFAEAVARLAAGFDANGIRFGDFVLIHLNNCPEFLLAWHACARLGAVAVTTNTRSSTDEVRYFAEHCSARFAVTEPALLDTVIEACPQMHWIACCNRAANGPALPDGIMEFDALFADAARAPARDPDPAAKLSVQYTSGTTSRPKGVVWTHANGLWGGRVNAAHAHLSGEDVHIAYFPLFHTNALAYSMLGTLWTGGTLVLLPRFSASRFWDIALRYRCTWANMIPFTLNALKVHSSPAHHWFRFWATGAADAPIVNDTWDIRCVGWWGMTETVSHGIVSHLTLPNTRLAMGLPATEYEIDIRTPDGATVSRGETGKLFIRGQRGVSLFLEYLNDPDATARAFDDDGWFDTGDRVTLLKDGAIAFSDREKDMLKVGGENVAASEIERVILGVPGVMEAAVVGKRDKVLDEVPVAFVIAANLGESLKGRIMETCREMLADFKWPREIYIVNELPRATLNKVSKKELRLQLQNQMEKGEQP